MTDRCIFACILLVSLLASFVIEKSLKMVLRHRERMARIKAKGGDKSSK